MSSAGILRYVAPRMARYAFDDPMAMSSSGGSWKSLFYFLLAAAGVGFAGYVYLVPYSKMERAVGSNQSAIADERRAAEIAISERDKLKADVTRLKAAVDEKKASDDKRKTTIDTLALQLKPGLEALGATVVAEPGALDVSFPANKMIDANGIDVSDGGMAAIEASSPRRPRKRAPRFASARGRPPRRPQGAAQPVPHRR